VLKDNGGQASAVNAGVERSTGDVIILLDADDLLHPQAAGRAADVFASRPDVVKIQSRMTVIDAAGDELGVKPPPHLPLPSGDVRAAELAFPFDMVWLPTSANAYRAAALRRIMPVPVEDFPRCGADWYVNHLCALLGSVLSLDDLGASYRVHGSNSYELESQSLDLGHLRHAIDHAEPTARRLAELADELDLPRPDRILSVSYLAYRLVSLRLEPGRHPVPGDRVPALWRDAVRAARRRSDVSTVMRLLFVAWFTVTAVAPAPAVSYLAELFFFHERRAGLNRLVARLHTRSPGAAAVR
jgi:glycosyltransferase involved in cell wall biosynthesis